MGKKVYWHLGVDWKDREFYNSLPSNLKSKFKAEIETTHENFNKLFDDLLAQTNEAEKLWRQSKKADFEALEDFYTKESKAIDEAYEVLSKRRQVLSETYQEKQSEILSTLKDFEGYKSVKSEIDPKLEGLRAVKSLALDKIRAKFEAKLG